MLDVGNVKFYEFERMIVLLPGLKKIDPFINSLHICNVITVAIKKNCCWMFTLVSC